MVLPGRAAGGATVGRGKFRNRLENPLAAIPSEATFRPRKLAFRHLPRWHG
jgi:hypothetical protein